VNFWCLFGFCSADGPKKGYLHVGGEGYLLTAVVLYTAACLLVKLNNMNKKRNKK